MIEYEVRVIFSLRRFRKRVRGVIGEKGITGDGEESQRKAGRDLLFDGETHRIPRRGSGISGMVTLDRVLLGDCGDLHRVLPVSESKGEASQSTSSSNQ